MAAPRSKELNKPHIVGLEHKLLEIVLGQFDDVIVATTTTATSTWK